MTTTAPVSETFTITEQITVRASLEQTFQSLIAEMGRRNQTPDGTPLPMILEPHPGGRWYRDLGGDNGHLWGFVQSIKRPTLLEIWGPLFMSTAATSNLLYADDGHRSGCQRRGRLLPHAGGNGRRARQELLACGLDGRQLLLVPDVERDLRRLQGASDALEADLDLVVEVLHGRPDLDDRDDLRGDVADDEVDALVAEAAHPLGIGITFRHAEKARQRHLGEDQVAGQRELEGAEREPLGRTKDAGRLGRPAGERVEPLGRSAPGAAAATGRASHQTIGRAHNKATTET